ncbi:hypothetical protein TIFTF001_046648 [Ficus carica]|uniref:Uncharacterized protein n=2 Tax=Ficus carica TaxID=3494 RepID=A0AA87ZJ09_FICCA|nr:hypothetical protein TIFTF001_046648 [Ficus carica]
MFLICNGLLVFLANYSGLVRSLSLSSQQDESHSKNFIASSQSESPMPPKKLELIAVPESIGLVENVAKEEGNEVYYLTNQRETEKEVVEDKEQEEKDQEQEEEDDEETALEHVAEHKDENKYWLKDDFLSEQEEEEDEDENEEVGNEEMNTEELNKKFDEFIRRMKEELRIEAQSQLIMV